MNETRYTTVTGINPVINGDFPDPDIIRVDDAYYMATTTMFLMPGCDILRSYDLVHWEFLAHAYAELDDTPAERLDEPGRNAYGKGMWAPSLRYHDGTYRIVFVANDTHRTYVLEARDPAGPWTKRTIEGFYHDNSVLYDDDGRVYIVYGNMQLHLTELEPDLSRPKPGGLDRIIAEDDPRSGLGYEGCHIYKHDGRYYVWTCHFPPNHRKTEACLVADSLDGEFTAREILDDDLGFHGLGDAQGGMVDTPAGDWYAFMMHDRGALGRALTIMPMRFGEDGFPILGDHGRVPIEVSVTGVTAERAGHRYAPLNGGDDFRYEPRDSKTDVELTDLKPFWQFNHNPERGAWSLTERPGSLILRTDRIVSNINHARNTLTQRTIGPRCAAEVTLDVTGLHEGDTAGLAAFQGYYRFIGVERTAGGTRLTIRFKPYRDGTTFGDGDWESSAAESASATLERPLVRLRAEYDFTDMNDTVTFFYRTVDDTDGPDGGTFDTTSYEARGPWRRLGDTYRLYYTLDYFIGCRIGLFAYSTVTAGGTAVFSDFRFIGASGIDAGR
ncbi:glycoside hydrolase 43 family protein [Bifidobacterium simiiventris]|uniref:glycoside hydrolase family 43 protein n=1 Tax=Bifidobacterium simiiventris TaxID=2834434 RepID=UPI001C5658D3|nr:glycoside hydrolase 43 family protein [Bifidobacterium simiiventris]MBW3078052.1 glycoside hydrolase 43 family protein [Bifidobacterium simiiventris]